MCQILCSFQLLVDLPDSITAQLLKHLSVDSPQHLMQGGSPPSSVSDISFLLRLLRRSSPRLQLTANSQLPRIIVLNKLVKESGLYNYINKHLWEQNYRIYSNSKRYLHRKVFKTQCKNLKSKQKKSKQKILLNDLTLNKNEYILLKWRKSQK